MKNCHYYDHVFSGIADIFLFNITLLMAFKMYTITNNFYEFAVNGRLPENESMNKNKLILRLIWAVSITDLLVYIFFCTYWTFINRDMEALTVFIFSHTSVLILEMICNAFLFYWSYCKFKKTLQKTIVDAR